MIIPKTKSLIVPLPKEQNYRVAEGRYAAKVQRVARIGKANGGDILRIFFEIIVPDKEQFVNIAKAEFTLNLETGSELRETIAYILGKEVMASLSGRDINLEELVGKAADVQVEHITTEKSDQYDYPYVKITGVKPAGTWVAVQNDK